MEPLLWLLLPVAAASGWVTAKVSSRIKSKENNLLSSKVNQHCIQGLNYVLNDQSDKAIEMLIRLVDVDEDTVDTHIVLGSLFRDRGEVDRAIRVHQNIIARPSIPTLQKQGALLQLGIDYFKAGLFDRAENIFDQLSDAEFKDSLLYEYQCRMFELEHEWERAIQAAQKLERYGNKSQSRRVAHYHCELVDKLIPTNLDAALKQSKKAVQLDKTCIRAYSQQGEVLKALGRSRDALKSYKLALEQSKLFAPMVLKQVMALLRSDGKLSDFPAFIKTHAELETNAAARFFLLQTYELLGEREEVNELLKNELNRLEASPYIINEYLEVMQKKTEGEVKASFGALNRVLEAKLSTYSACHCIQCGFESNVMFWQCPSCQDWGSLEPYQNLMEYSWLDS